MKRIDDLEFYELLQAVYPKEFGEETDENWEKAQNLLNAINDFCESYECFDFFKLDEFLNKLIYLTVPLKSELTGEYAYCLGTQLENGGFMAIVQRKVKSE